MSNLLAVEMLARDARETAPSRAADPRAEVFELVCRHVRKLTGAGAADYDDIVQSAAERVLRELPKYEGRASLSTWVFRVCYTVMIDQRRVHRRWLSRFRLEPASELADVASVPPGAEQQLRRLERNRRLQTVLQRMSPKLSSVLMLHDLQGMSVEAVAEALDLNELTVRSRLRDGRKDLSRRLKRDPYFGEAAGDFEEVGSDAL